MELSKYQIQIIEEFLSVAPKIIFNNYTPDCCIAATRITIDFLKKYHFKDVKPLVVEANVFNQTYFSKGRTPQSDEEAQEWLKEGAWQVVVGDKKEETPGKWPGHLVALVNNEYIIDIAIMQATRPEKKIFMLPLFNKVPASFVSGEDKCGLVINNCLVVYVSFPQDSSFQKAKDWYDKSKAEKLVKEAFSEVKKRLENDKKRS